MSLDKLSSFLHHRRGEELDKRVGLSEMELPPASPPSSSLHPSVQSGAWPADSDETQHYSTPTPSVFPLSSPLLPLSALSPSCCDLRLLHSLFSDLLHKKLDCKHDKKTASDWDQLKYFFFKGSGFTAAWRRERLFCVLLHHFILQMFQGKSCICL